MKDDELWKTLPEDVRQMIMEYLPAKNLKKMANVGFDADVLEFMHQKTGIPNVSFETAQYNLDQMARTYDPHPVRVATLHSLRNSSGAITDNGYLSLFAVSTGADPFQKNDPCLLMISPENISLENFDLVYDIISHQYYVNESGRANRVGGSLALRRLTSYLRQIPSVIVSEKSQISQCLKKILQSHTTVRVTTIESNSSRIYFRPATGVKTAKCMDSELDMKLVQAVLQKGYLDRHFSVFLWKSHDVRTTEDEFLLYKRMTTELIKTSHERWGIRVGAICHLMMRMDLRGSEEHYSYDPRHHDMDEYKVNKMLQILKDIGNIDYSIDAIESLRVFVCSCLSSS